MTNIHKINITEKSFSVQCLESPEFKIVADVKMIVSTIKIPPEHCFKNMLVVDVFSVHDNRAIQQVQAVKGI